MLVYSTAFLIDSPGTCPQVLAVVADWLSGKTHTRLSGAMLERTDNRRLQGGSSLETATCTSTAPRLYGVKYSHRDSTVSGRQWTTEIGLREREQSRQVECTILLQTSEISPLVPPLQITTRPKLISEIAKRCRVASDTFGLTLRQLESTNTDAFANEIHNLQRSQPLVLISATPSGDYLVDAELLRDQLVTLADVVVIPPDADTFEIADTIGDKYAAWRGAINVIFPVTMMHGTPQVYTKKFLPSELGQISAAVRPESRLLSEVTHRTNLPNKWRHISLEFVREENFRRDLARKRQEALQKGEQKEYIEVLEKTHADDEKRVADLNGDLNQWETLYADIDAEVKSLRAENEGLKAALNSKEEAESASAGMALGGQRRDALVDCLRGKRTPEKVLSGLAALFPERIAVLPSAVATSRRSEKFKDVDKLADLLIKLSSNYWQMLMDGKGDAGARKIFGESYAARESETVEANKRARKLRTFEYQGKPIVMMKHLRIGVKESAAETIRVHFEWLPGEKRIVIGYCGPHRDHK